jgi:Raf kinase inhibitor-like YbhB/YbcL family protein
MRREAAMRDPFLFVAVLALVVGMAASGVQPRREGFTLASPAFGAGERIPKVYTCDGSDESPALFWSGAPEGTRSFALICDDPDAPVGTWTHWVIYGIPAEQTKLHEGTPASPDLPGGVKQGLNSWKRAGYGGPCPPPGKPHRYFFVLYALDSPLGLPPGASKEQVQAAMKGHILGRAELMGVYGR